MMPSSGVTLPFLFLGAGLLWWEERSSLEVLTFWDGTWSSVTL